MCPSSTPAVSARTYKSPDSKNLNVDASFTFLLVASRITMGIGKRRKIRTIRGRTITNRIKIDEHYTEPTSTIQTYFSNLIKEDRKFVK
jgi:hypothetical protein